MIFMYGDVHMTQRAALGLIPYKHFGVEMPSGGICEHSPAGVRMVTFADFARGGQTWVQNPGAGPTLRGCFQDGQFRQSVMALRPPHEEDVSLLRIFDVAIWMLYSKSKAARKARRAVGMTPQI